MKKPKPYAVDTLAEMTAFANLVEAARAVLRAPVIESGRPGSVTIELQTFNRNDLRAALDDEALARAKREIELDIMRSRGEL